MTNDKWFIPTDKKAFSNEVTEVVFRNSIEGEYKFNYFDESGILKGQCPQCSGCGKGFIDPKIPDNSVKGLIEREKCVQRMQIALEKYIQKEIDLKLETERLRIEEEVKSKYPEIKQQNQE